MQESNKQNEITVSDARSLIEPIAHARSGIAEAQALVAQATKSLYKDKVFPEQFAAQINDVSIKFTVEEFIAGKALHRLNRGLLNSIFEFARETQELVDRKEKIGRLFNARKNDINGILEQGAKPLVSYGVFVQRDNSTGNAVGTFVKLAKPYRFSEKENEADANSKDKPWPEDIDLNVRNEVVKAKRYKSGEPFVQVPRNANDKPTVFLIPLEPDGVTREFPSPLSQRVEQELKEIALLIVGTNPSETHVDLEKKGLLRLADEIKAELCKGLIGNATCDAAPVTPGEPAAEPAAAPAAPAAPSASAE